MKRIFISIFLLIGMTLNAQVTTLDSLAAILQKYEGRNERPRIGLALAGGGAKGAAHIGVLRELERYGIPVDYVAGTSMGSIIGGLYAIGYSPDEMEYLISNMDWSLYMSNKVMRTEISSRDKVNDNRYLLSVPFKTGADIKRNMRRQARRDTVPSRNKDLPGNFSKTFLKSLPGGFISGNNVLNLLNSLCVGYQDSISFDSLPIPYACVTTNVMDGKPVVIRSGNLPTAIRASMAIPGVFAPVKIGDHLLVDGGMVNNFPVDICREMGADIVIGVEVSSDPRPRVEDLSSLPALLGHLMHTVTSGNTVDNRASCDFYINPDIKGYNMLSFDKNSIDSLISIGERGAHKKADMFRALSDFLRTFPEIKTGARPKARNISKFSKEEIPLSLIECTGVNGKDFRWLLKKAKLDKRTSITGEELDNAISFFYGTNYYSKVTYNLEENGLNPGTYNLTINFTPSEPHNLGFGFRFDSQETAAILLKLGLNERKLNGVKLNISTRLSYNPWANLTLTLAPRIWPSFNVAYTFKKVETSVRDNGENFLSMNYLHHNAEAYFSEFHSRNIHVGVGLKMDAFHVRDLKGKMVYEDLTNTYMGLAGRFTYDNLDRGYIAGSGVKFDLNAGWMFTDFKTSAYQDFGDIRFNFEGYIPMGKSRRVVLIPQIYSRFLIGPEVPLMYRNVLGSTEPGRYFSQQLPFIGANKPEALYNNAGILRADLRTNVYGKHYVSAMVNYCRESRNIQQFLQDSGPAASWWGYGLRYTFDSPAGPLSLDMHWSSLSKKFGMYLNLGFYF